MLKFYHFIHCLCISLFLSATGVLITSAHADESVSGFFRWEKNRLELSSGCALRVPKGILVVLSNNTFNCQKGLGTEDPSQAYADHLMETDQGSLTFTLEDNLNLVSDSISFQTWKPMDSVSLQSPVKIEANFEGGIVSGKLTSNGVQIIPMSVDKELEAQASFTLKLLE